MIMVPPQFYRVASNVSYTIGGVAWLLVLGYKGSLRAAFFALLASMTSMLAAYAISHWVFRKKPFALYMAWLAANGTKIDLYAYASLWVAGAYFVDPWYSSGALALLYFLDETGMFLSRKWLDAEHKISNILNDEDVFS